jgi:hypothetical protein
MKPEAGNKTKNTATGDETGTEFGIAPRAAIENLQSDRLGPTSVSGEGRFRNVLESNKIERDLAMNLVRLCLVGVDYFLRFLSNCKLHR